MHIAELEAHRMEKEHKMRHGYQDHSNKKYPHDVEVSEHAPIFKDTENRHARQTEQKDYKDYMEHSL